MPYVVRRTNDPCDKLVRGGQVPKTLGSAERCQLPVDLYKILLAVDGYKEKHFRGARKDETRKRPVPEDWNGDY